MATYTKDYVVVMMVSQAGTGSGTSGPAVRKIWEALYGINGEKVDPSKAVIPGVHAAPPAAGLHRRRLDPAPDHAEAAHDAGPAGPSLACSR